MAFQPFGPPDQNRQMLGDLVAPQQPRVPQSMNDIPPEQRNDPGFQQRLSGWMDHLKKPEVMAAILQFSHEMGNSQGSIFKALGNATTGGIQAAGRVQAMREQQRLAEQEGKATAEQQQFERQQTERRTQVQEQNAQTNLQRMQRVGQRGGGGAPKAEKPKDLSGLSERYFEMLGGGLGGEDEFTLLAASRSAARLDAEFGWSPDVIGALVQRNPIHIRIADLAIQKGMDPQAVQEAFMADPDMAANNLARILGLTSEEVDREEETSTRTAPIVSQEESTRNLGNPSSVSP